MVAASCHLHTAQARPPGVPQAALQKPRESLAPPTYVKKRAWPEDAGTASLPPSPDEVRPVNGGDHGGTLSWSHNMHRAFTDNEWTVEPHTNSPSGTSFPLLPLHDQGPSPFIVVPESPKYALFLFLGNSVRGVTPSGKGTKRPATFTSFFFWHRRLHTRPNITTSLLQPRKKEIRSELATSGRYSRSGASIEIPWQAGRHVKQGP